MKAILIDDEARARSALETMLSLFHPEIVVCASCADVPQGVLAINKLQPDVVFLDIEMPGYSGFELLDFIPNPTFAIVFVTAYSEYAIKAFEVSAIDYLLKPVTEQTLGQAVAKVQKLREQHQLKERLETLAENMRSDSIRRIALPVAEGLLFVETNHLQTLSADGSYTQVTLHNNSRLVISKKLGYFEEILSSRSNFFRIHRSHIINLNYVKKYNRFDHTLLMDNGTLLPIAKDRKADFEKSLEQVRVG